MSDPLNHLGSLLYHSEPLEVPYSLNQFLGLDFFCRFLQQAGSSRLYSYYLTYSIEKKKSKKLPVLSKLDELQSRSLQVQLIWFGKSYQDLTCLAWLFVSQHPLSVTPTGLHYVDKSEHWLVYLLSTGGPRIVRFLRHQGIVLLKIVLSEDWFN